MPSLDDFANEKLAELERAHLRRTLADTERTDGIWAIRNGRRLLSFSCNDYLGLTQHPALKAAAIAAIERHGVGAGASRLVTGNHPLYAELETRLARLKGTEAACVFGSGYLVNAGVTPALAGRDDLVLIDELAHSSLWTGARLSRATVHAFKHNDLNARRSADERASRQASPRADRDRGRVLDGRRPRAARRARRAGGANGRPGCSPTTRTISISPPPRAPACRCGSARCRRRSAPTAAMSRPRSR